MDLASRKPTGFVLDQDARDELHRLVSEEDLDSIANDVGVSPLTLCKALGGHPVSAMTVLNVQRFIEDSDDVNGDDAGSTEEGTDAHADLEDDEICENPDCEECNESTSDDDDE
jgi:hypothetical protein